MAGYIATAVHDVDHPGHKNDFEAKNKSTLATIYNDQSVLENYHVAIAFTLMRASKEHDLLSEFDNPTEIRALIVKWVLGTDMANHGS